MLPLLEMVGIKGLLYLSVWIWLRTSCVRWLRASHIDRLLCRGSGWCYINVLLCLALPSHMTKIMTVIASIMVSVN